MTTEAERLLEAALDLPDAERSELVAILADSLRGPDAEIEAAWIEEAKRRLARIRSGESKTVPWEEVERELEDIIEAPDAPDRIAR